MKKFLSIVAILFMVACNTDDYTNSWSRSFEDDFTTTNTTTGDSYVDNAVITVEITDTSKPFLNITIEGIKFVPMMPDVNFVLSNVPFKIYPSDNAADPLYRAWIFNEEAVVPTVGGISREEYTMLNFEGSISNYGFVVDFDVNFGGTLYHASFGEIAALQTWEAAFEATAAVIINPGENSTVSEDRFNISFKQENLSVQVVDITLEGLRFVEQMPEITMEFKNVAFSYSEDASQRLFNVASVIPTVGGEAMPQYTITNLTGSVSKGAVLLDCELAAMNAHISVSGSTKK